jgi:hypothetical protein
MSDTQRTSDPGDVRVIPGDSARHVGQLVASKIFEKHGNPSSLSMDIDGLTALCALAAQTVLNAARGEWQ